MYVWAELACGALAVVAALAVGRWPERRRMALLIVWWVVCSLGVDLTPSTPLVSTLVLAFNGLMPAAYAHMVLAYPSGYLRRGLDRGFVVTAYAVSLATELPPALFADFRCAGCLPQAPSLLFTGTVLDLTVDSYVVSVVYGLLALCFLALLVRRVRAAPEGARRTLVPFLAAGVYAAAEFIVWHAGQIAGWRPDALNWLDRLNMVVLPLAMLAGIARIRRDRGPLGDLVVELGTARPGQIRGALARAVGDPSLELALWLPERGRFVDEAGAVVGVEAAPGRAVTMIGEVAALVHDAELSGQGALLEAAGSAGRLALENARLQAELRAQLAELRASRARVVEASDAGRRRVERDLHDGAQQRLLALGLALQRLREDRGNGALLDSAQAELHAALRELRELARGIHPAILSDRGLGAAVASLADRAPIPVTVRVTSERHVEAAESAAYFVVSEALANVVKHARARSARVSIAGAQGRLVVEVADDGRGGADAASGSGLQGLADRVGALDGHFSVRTAAGAGTAIRAEIPCASCSPTIRR